MVSFLITQFSPYSAVSQLQKMVFVKKIGLHEGLSSVNVKKIIKDTKGFIWIATQDGLNKYDGKKIVSYGKETKGISLSNVDIWDMQLDTINNHLWILEYDALDCIDVVNQKTIKKYNSDFFSPLVGDNVWLKQMALIGDEIWIGTNSATIILNTKTNAISQLNSYSKSKRFEKSINSIESLFYENANCIWLMSPFEGITTINPINKSVINQYGFSDSAAITIKPNNNNRAFYSVKKINTNEHLCATTSGLITVYTDGKGQLDFNKGYKGFFFRETIKSVDYKNNKLLIATANGLYSIYNNKKIAFFDATSREYGDWFENITNVNEDESIIYIASQKGLGIITSKPWLEKFTKSLDNKRFEHTYFQHPVNDSVIFISTPNEFIKFNTSNLRAYSIAEGKPFYFSFLLDDSSLLVSSNNQFYIYKENRLLPVQNAYPELNKISSEAFNSMQRVNKDEYVLGSESQKGIYIWNKKTKTCLNISTESKSPRLLTNIVNYVFVNENKEIIVLSDNYVSRVNSTTGQVTNIQYKDALGKTYTFYFDLIEGKDFYAITVYGQGVLLTDKNFRIKKTYALKDGLTNLGVYKLFNYNDSIIYVTTNNGFAGINLKTGNLRMFFESDGLHSNSFEEGSGTIYKDKIFAGGNNGFTIIRPSELKLNSTPPKLYISRCFIETKKMLIDSSALELTKMGIPNDVLQTTIYFSAINWSNPDQIKFAWRVKERNNEWSNIGIQNFITLIGLSPGTYHIQVKAANEDGVWSEPKELVLEFLPKWYQTWLFKLLVFLATASIIYAFYRYRIRQIEKQHAIRKNIATDLHDDLGSTLNSVKVFTNLAISGVKQEESLQQVKDNLTEATMSLRDMIWVLDDSLDTVDELVTRLKQFAFPITAASSMELVISAGSDVNSRNLTKEEKRNLFLICKEAINNSIKYSGATQITIAIIPAGKKIQIIVSDNGKGFDEATVKKGYGLKNMQYRAGQIHYKLEVNSTSGTVIKIIPG
ncbi:sensor histidine kinase [Ferruginibacter sp.]